MPQATTVRPPAGRKLTTRRSRAGLAITVPSTWTGGTAVDVEVFLARGEEYRIEDLLEDLEDDSPQHVKLPSARLSGPGGASRVEVTVYLSRAEMEGLRNDLRDWLGDVTPNRNEK